MVIAGCDAPPILEPAEHDLDAVSLFVSAFVVFDARLALLPAGDARAYPFVLQRFSEPVGVVAAIPKQPVDFWKAAEQRPCPDVIADLSGVTNRSIGRPWLSQIRSRAALCSCRLLCDQSGAHAPPFSAHTGRGSMGLEVGRVDHHDLLFAMLRDQICQHPREDALLAPALPTTLERLVRTIGGRSITPAQAIAIDENYSAQHAPVVNSGLTVRLREKGLQTCHLRVGKPEKIVHRSVLEP